MEYKFRGKSKQTDEWVYGSYHCCNQKGIMRTRKWGTVMDTIEQEVQFDSHWILVLQTPDSPGWEIRETFIPHEVYPESVGMLLDAKDDKGQFIHEGDIVMCWDQAAAENSMFGLYHTGVITFSCNSFCLKVGDIYLQHWPNAEHIELLGNCTDNPELLNPPADSPALNTMTTDPNVKTEEEVKAPATETEQEQVPGTPAVIEPDSEETEG